MQTPEAFIVGYSPVPAAGRVARGESMMRRALLSVAIYLAISIGLWLWLRHQLGIGQILLGGIPSAALVLGFVVWRWLELRSARASLGRVPAGEALRIDHIGVHTSDGEGHPTTTHDWAGLGDIRVEGKKLGAGPNLLIDHTRGHWQVPVSYLDTLPGTIDSAIRAYSGGRRGLDLSGMDSIWGE